MMSLNIHYDMDSLTRNEILSLVTERDPAPGY